MKALITPTILIATIGSAWAQDMPRYDPQKWCNEVANSGGTRSEMIYGGCIDQEQTAYDEIKATWPRTPDKIRRWCDQVARSGGKGSYMILGGCIEQETEARQQNTTKSFRY